MRSRPFILAHLAYIGLLIILAPGVALAQEGGPDPSLAFWGISAIGAMFSVVGGIILALYHRNAGATDARIREVADQVNRLGGIIATTREEYVRRPELETLREDWGSRIEALERRMVERDHELKADLKEVENEVKAVQVRLTEIGATNSRILDLLERSSR